MVKHQLVQPWKRRARMTEPQDTLRPVSIGFPCLLMEIYPLVIQQWRIKILIVGQSSTFVGRVFSKILSALKKRTISEWLTGAFYAGNFQEWSTITINNHPSNPQQPIHSHLATLRLAPVSFWESHLPTPSRWQGLLDLRVTRFQIIWRFQSTFRFFRLLTGMLFIAILKS